MLMLLLKKSNHHGRFQDSIKKDYFKKYFLFYNKQIFFQKNMSKNSFILTYQKAAGRQKYFIEDPNSNFYILFEKKLYNLRKQFLKSSAYLMQKISQNERVHVILQELQVGALEKVLGCLYGLAIEIERGAQILQILEVLRFLQISDLEQLIKKQVKRNFSHYELFLLLDLAHNYMDNQLQQRCHRQLIINNFQQFNFNRLEVLKCKKQVFQALIKIHQKQKNSGRINGLTFQNLRKVVVDYNSANDCKVDILTVMAPPASQIIIEDIEGEKQSPVPQFNSGLKKYQTIDIQFQNQDLAFAFSCNFKSEDKYSRKLSNIKNLFNDNHFEEQTHNEMEISQSDLMIKQQASQRSTSPKSQQNNTEEYDRKNSSQIKNFLTDCNNCFLAVPKPKNNLMKISMNIECKRQTSNQDQKRLIKSQNVNNSNFCTK